MFHSGEAQQHLQRNQHPQKSTDVARGETSAGPGFVAGQLGDNCDIEPQYARPNKGGWSEGESIANRSRSKQKIAGPAQAHQEGAENRHALEADVIEHNAQDEGQGDWQGIEEGRRKGSDPQEDEGGGSGVFTRNLTGWQRALRPITLILGIAEEVVENQPGYIKKKACRQRQ